MSKLSQYLAAERLTQAEFAARIGVAQATVSRLRAGTATPSLRLAQRIAQETNGFVSVFDWGSANGEATATDQRAAE